MYTFIARGLFFIDKTEDQLGIIIVSTTFSVFEFNSKIKDK